MNVIKVSGKNKKHKILMYAISTCPWCKLAKKFLKENNIEYEYVDIDLATREDREKIRRDILNHGGKLIYPAIIIDDKKIINHFKKDELRKALEI